MNYKYVLWGIAALALVALLIYGSKGNSLGGAPSGLAATVATTSIAQVVTSGTAELIFATTTNCAARVIGTRQGEIRLTFSDRTGDRPTAISGFTQPASTTVNYDAGVYGCDAVYAFPYLTETISLTELR